MQLLPLFVELFFFLLPKEDESLAENGSGASGLWGGAVTLSGFLPINLPRWHCVSVHLCLGGTVSLCICASVALHCATCLTRHCAMGCIWAHGRHSASIPPALTIVPGGTVLYPVAVPAFFSLYTESIESILQHWMSVEQCGAVWSSVEECVS